MPDYDLVVRGASPWPAIGITDGRIAGLADGTAHEEIDATGLLVLPGVVDAHVHFNEPGRTEWEGWATGSRAAVAGGVTTVCDMPLNSLPPVVTAEAFRLKRAAAEAQAVCDFALWGGLVPGGVEELDALAACGAIGFKAFMSNSGVDDFPKVDLATLRAGMRRAASLGLPVAVHAEFDRPIAHGDGSDAGTVAAYLASRPIDSECDAIRAALDLAGETGCALHVVHVSSARGVALIADARARGVNVTAETCPHYLVFTGEDVARIGAAAKCAPPMRDAAEREALLARVHAGDVDTIGSDHSPSPWTMKTHENFFRVWGGIAGVQHLLPLALDTLGLDAALVARLTAAQVARRFRFDTKGRIADGCDADFTLVEVDLDGGAGGGYEITADSLLYKHRVSPYIGLRPRARVRQTFVRGRIVFRDGQVLADRGGRLIVGSPS
jgi:allantoinase